MRVPAGAARAGAATAQLAVAISYRRLRTFRLRRLKDLPLVEVYVLPR